MKPIILKWKRFTSFLDLRKAFRSRPCIYLQTDPDEKIIRVGESDDIFKRYYGGTAYALEAALHGSGNLFFVSSAPVDMQERRALEAALIYDLQPRYCNKHKILPPLKPTNYVHEGEVPHGIGSE